MKITYLCQPYPPMVSGAANVVQRLAEGIAAKGHSVMVLAASNKGTSYTRESQGVEVLYLRSLQNPLRVDQHFVPWNRADIEQALQIFQPGVLHIQDPLNIGLAGLWSAKRLNIPIILTIHQLPWFVSSYIGKSQFTRDLVENSLWGYSNWFLGKCDHLITPSQTIADIIDEHTDHRPKVISNGVDLCQFNPSQNKLDETSDLCQKYGIHPNLPIILFVGRIDPDKKVDLVIRSAARVMQDIPAQLLIVGDGTQRNEVIQLSKNLGIFKDCCFPGFVSMHGDLPGIYRLASVFVTASEVEIQSSVVLEAAASGLPVVTVNASSMPELVQNEVSGFLVTPGDIDQISDRILFILRNPEVQQKMGRAGRRLAENHSSEVFIQAHEQFYQEITLDSKVYLDN